MIIVCLETNDKFTDIKIAAKAFKCSVDVIKECCENDKRLEYISNTGIKSIYTLKYVEVQNDLLNR